MTYFDAPYRPADLTLNSDSINNSLVGFWPLTDGTGTTATDLTSNAFNGSRSSGTWTSSDIGTVANFTGISNTAFNCGNVDASGGTGITLTAWVKANPCSNARILSKDNGSSRDYFIKVAGTNSAYSVIQAGAWADDGTLVTLNSTGYIYANTWHHIAMTWDNSTLKVFIDGELDSSTAFAKTGPRNGAGSHMAIGGRAVGGNEFFSGEIGNARIYDRSLSDSEIATLYSRPWTGTNYDTEALWLSPPASPTLSTASEATSIMTSCLGWWPLTEGSGSTATDLVGSNDGTLASSVTWESGILGTATEYPSTPYEYTSTTLDLAGKSAVTVSAWIKNGGSSAGNGFGKIISQSHSGSFDSYMNKPSNASLSFDINSTVVMANNSDIPPIDTWFHVCFVWQQSTTQAIYINGELSNSGTADGSVIGTTSHNVFFGGTTDVYGNRPWDGGIQNVRIWDRALSATEVSTLYERPWIGAEYNESFYLYPPVPSSLTPLDSSSINTDQELWLPLTDGTGTTAVDISANSNDLTNTFGTLGWINSELGTAADFTGTGLLSTSTVPTLTDKLTISQWLYYEGSVSRETSFAGHSGSSSYAWAFRTENNGDYMRFFVNGSYIDSSQLPLDQWVHIVGVYDGTDIRLYINGVQDGTPTSVTGNVNSFTSIFIGNQNASSSVFPFTGFVQNTRLWSRALSASEVADIYYSPWLGSAYTGTSSDPVTNRYFSPAAFARLG